MRLCFLIFIALFLSGCGYRGLPFKYNAESFANNKKGIVLVRVSEREPSTSPVPTDVNLAYHLRKMGQEAEGDYIILPGVENRYNYAENMLMLDPGIYYFDYIRLLSTGSLLYWCPSPGMRAVTAEEDEDRFVVQYGAFEVKPGKVIYLGHLNMKAGLKDLPFKVIDEIDQARMDLNKKGHTVLAQKLEPAEFYQRGSLYVVKNGAVQIISRKKLDALKSAFIDMSIKLLTK